MLQSYDSTTWFLPPADPVAVEEWSKNMDATCDCLSRANQADWWKWKSGSRLFFWFWSLESRRWARDGLPVHLLSPPPQYRKPQPVESDPSMRVQVRSKLDKFRQQRYIQQGTVMSLTSYFSVPKGDGDIRLVFDGTKSGLNACLWAPSFILPTVTSLLYAVEPGTWMSDIDIGEQFYNYMLDPSLQPYCGIDISSYFEEASSWEQWTRCVMGLKTSPYGCTRMEMLGDEIAKGCYQSPDNPFHFDKVRLNLPGSTDYDPSHPWVSKIVSSCGRIAGDVKTYVDDKRPSGYSHSHCLRVTRRAASMLGYLGEQDATRKRVPHSQRAGAWAGAVCHTDNGHVTVLVTQDKWDKAKGYVALLQDQLVKDNTFNHKELERIRGFLVYFVRTYPSFSPYLKGIHLTLDSWQPGRDQEGWKIANFIHHHLHDDSFPIDTSAPVTVKGVPRLRSDLMALSTLFAAATPP
jgi:hypothetical protein